MKRRLFIAINLPEKIKEKVFSIQKKWPELPCRWTKKENLHITLVFLGYVLDEKLPEIIEIVKKIVLKNKPFLINFIRIIYGPKGKKIPGMIWLEAEKNFQLIKIQKELKEILEEKILNVEKETRPFSPHLTLARIKQWELKRMEPEEIPEINEEISISFEVEKIDLMESHLKPKGSDYYLLESFPLAGK